MTGGFTGLEITKVTEIFSYSTHTWKFVGDLPRARNGLRATNVDNIIYVLGKYHIIGFIVNSTDNVLQVEIQRY